MEKRRTFTAGFEFKGGDMEAYRTRRQALREMAEKGR